MQLLKLHILLTTVLTVLLSCSKKTAATTNPLPTPDTLRIVYPLVPAVNEISGIADSKTNPGFLWAHEDSGNPPKLYLVGHDGKVKGSVFIAGATNTDWEDIAVANGELYVADIGDNNNVRSSLTVYKFPEPAAGTDTVRIFETIRFMHPDRPHDAEAILVDPVSKDIFVITKRDIASGIYKVRYPYSLTTVNTAEYVSSLPYTGVVSAALTADGNGIIIKTYPSLFYYKRPTGLSIPSALQQSFATIKYVTEPQGEAVCFALNNTGYFTVSEKGMSTEVNLNYYKTK